VSYRRFGGWLGAGHDLSLSTRFSVDYRLEAVDAVVPTVASHVRGNTREPLELDILPGSSVLSGLSASFIYDTRERPFLPTRGTLGTLRGTLGLEVFGSSYAYQKLELSLQHWWRLPWRHVVSLQMTGGVVAGDAPFFERFYVGDYTDLLPDRILGLNPDRRQPPNHLGTSIAEIRYADYAGRLQGEYRVPLYSGGESVYGIDFFAAAGIYGAATERDFDDPPSGYEPYQRVPIDLSYNLGVRVETYIGGFSVAFSNLLGLLPARGGDRK